jgi:hypothetical protein
MPARRSVESSYMARDNFRRVVRLEPVPRRTSLQPDHGSSRDYPDRWLAPGPRPTWFISVMTRVTKAHPDRPLRDLADAG